MSDYRPRGEADGLTRGELEAVTVDIESEIEFAVACGADEMLLTMLRGDLRRFQAELGRRGGAVEPDNQPPTNAAITICIADVQRETVGWLWTHRIPNGKLTIIEGDPGVGKSQLTLAIASAVTTGAPLPGDSERRDPGVVLILSAEDGLGDTIRPRLESMGADLSRVIALTGMHDSDGRERAVNLADLEVIEGAVMTHKPALVIVDPLIAYTGGADTHKANEVRGMLAPLAALAERHGCAVLAVRHLNKGTGRAIYRGQGSIDFLAACRSAFLVGKNPENTAEKVLIHIKSNLGPETPALSFSIEDGRFEWGQQSTLTADQLLAEPANGEERNQTDEATEFLSATLAKGAVASKDVIKAARENGISDRTLWRAKKRLGVKAIKGSFAGAWEWALPVQACHSSSKSAKTVTVADMAELAGLGAVEDADWREITT